MYLTNTSRGHYVQFVIGLVLYDTYQFEYEFFESISRAFPLLKYLTLDNLIALEKKCEIEPIKDKN
jgi:hypothetical protein